MDISKKKINGTTFICIQLICFYVAFQLISTVYGRKKEAMKVLSPSKNVLCFILQNEI